MHRSASRPRRWCTLRSEIKEEPWAACGPGRGTFAEQSAPSARSPATVTATPAVLTAVSADFNPTP